MRSGAFRKGIIRVNQTSDGKSAPFRLNLSCTLLRLRFALLACLHHISIKGRVIYIFFISYKNSSIDSSSFFFITSGGCRVLALGETTLGYFPILDNLNFYFLNMDPSSINFAFFSPPLALSTLFSFSFPQTLSNVNKEVSHNMEVLEVYH